LVGLADDFLDNREAIGGNSIDYSEGVNYINTQQNAAPGFGAQNQPGAQPQVPAVTYNEQDVQSLIDTASVATDGNEKLSEQDLTDFIIDNSDNADPGVQRMVSLANVFLDDMNTTGGQRIDLEAGNAIVANHNANVAAAQGQGVGGQPGQPVDVQTQYALGTMGATANAFVNDEGLNNSAIVNPELLAGSGFTQVAPGVYQSTFTRTPVAPPNGQPSAPSTVTETWYLNDDGQATASQKSFATHSGTTTLSQTFAPATGQRTSHSLTATETIQGQEAYGLPDGQYTTSLQVNGLTGEQSFSSTFPNGQTYSVTPPEGQALFDANGYFNSNVTFTMLNNQMAQNKVAQS
jgi:hypothetical protein